MPVRTHGAPERRLLADRRLRLLVVFVVALALRLAYLLQIRDNVSFQIIAVDSEFFDLRALEILRGDFWGSEVFYSAPLYPYFLALIYAVGGPSFLLVRIVQIVLGSVTAVLVVLVAERMFEEPVPLVAGLLSALYAPFIFFDASILGATLAVCLATLSVLLFSLALLKNPFGSTRGRSGRSVGGATDRLERSPDREDGFFNSPSVSESGARRKGLVTFLAGAAVGLTCLIRPNAILLVPLWVVCLWSIRGGLRWVRPAAVFAIGSALVIAPVTVRNAAVGGDFVPISSHGGINFWIGNHPQATGAFNLPPGVRGTPEQVNLVDSTRLASEAAGRPLKPSEVSSCWFAKGWAHIKDHPRQAGRLFLRKLRMFWNRIEIPLNVNFHFLERSSPLLRIPLMHFGLISPLALLGIGLSLRRGKTLLPAYAFVATFLVSAVAFFVSGRYRLPVVPVLIIFASFAGWWLYSRARDRRWKPLALAAGALVPLALHANVPVEGYSLEQSFARDAYYLAVHYQSQGQLAEAVGYYEESIRRNPGFWMAHNGLGTCLSDLGKLDEAVESFHRAIELAPTRPEPWSNLGIALASHGRIEEAVPYWERALELDPDCEQASASLLRARSILRGRPERPPGEAP